MEDDSLSIDDKFLLIEEVRTHEALWKQKASAYKMRNKEDIWKQVGEKFRMSGKKLNFSFQ